MNHLQVRSEAIINAPVRNIWALITNIDQLPKVNPGVVKAWGRMDILGETRTCDINNNGRTGTMTEKLIELIPQQRTVWTIETDTLGMGRMLRHTQFIFNLEKVSEVQTKVISETYYVPATFIARVMNALMIRKMIAKAQEQILTNIKLLTEKNF